MTHYTVVVGGGRACPEGQKAGFLSDCLDSFFMTQRFPLDPKRYDVTTCQVK